VRMREDEIINNMSEQSEGCANSPEPRELHQGRTDGPFTIFGSSFRFQHPNLIQTPNIQQTDNRKTRIYRIVTSQ